MRYAVLLTCLLAVALPTDDPVIARAGDTELHRSQFGDWLVSRYGSDFVEEFVGDQLVLEEAARRGLTPTDEQIDAAYDKELDDIVRHLHDGSLQKFEDELKLKGLDLQSYARHRKHGVRIEVAEGNLARVERTVTEDGVRARFDEEYGPDGENVRVGVLFFSSFQRAPAGDAAPDFAALRASARARADAARAALQAGKPLADLLPDGDKPASDAVVNGIVDHYRTRLLGTEVERAVASLDNAGEISTVIDVYDGCYVVQLIERTAVPFESARADIERELREAPVTSDEFLTVRAAIVAARAPEYLER